jgi:hypothetical protein
MMKTPSIDKVQWSSPHIRVDPDANINQLLDKMRDSVALIENMRVNEDDKDLWISRKKIIDQYGINSITFSKDASLEYTGMYIYHYLKLSFLYILLIHVFM